MSLQIDTKQRCGRCGVEVLLEYCQWETFNATCSRGSVVVMQSARYGRMKHGRCADTDVYIGCSADVLLQMDERCSGRQSCMLAIPDSYLHQQQPCPNDMMAYLEASFVCVRGTYVGQINPAHDSDTLWLSITCIITVYFVVLCFVCFNCVLVFCIFLLLCCLIWRNK